MKIAQLRGVEFEPDPRDETYLSPKHGHTATALGCIADLAEFLGTGVDGYVNLLRYEGRGILKRIYDEATRKLQAASPLQKGTEHETK